MTYLEIIVILAVWSALSPLIFYYQGHKDYYEAGKEIGYLMGYEQGRSDEAMEQELNAANHKEQQT